MNKKNKILVGCLALLLVLSVDYALFSDTITINGTATAKGDFAYEITTMKSVDPDINSDEIYGIYLNDKPGSELFSNYSDETGVSESSISSESNTVTYQANFTKPGEVQYFTVKITNTGTIPITVDFWNEFTYDYTISGTVTMDDGVVLNISDIEKMAQGYTNPYSFNSTDLGNIETSVVISFEEAFISKEAYDEVYEELDTNPNALPKLDNGESAYIVFKATWRDRVNLRKDIVGMDLIATQTVTIPVKQVTVQ